MSTQDSRVLMYRMDIQEVTDLQMPKLINVYTYEWGT